MPHERAVLRSIARAEALLPGRPSPDGETDPRWQAIMRVGEFIESEPEAVWSFASRWAKHPQRDLQNAIACCLLEHLLEYHFDLLFPRVQQTAEVSVRFARVFESCWSYGQAKVPRNAARVRRLKSRLQKKRSANRRAA